MNPTDIVDRPNLRSGIPDFGPGDNVKDKRGAPSDDEFHIGRCQRI